MTKLAEISKRLDRAVASAVDRHRGPRLWLLSSVQLEHYKAWQTQQSNRMAQYEGEYGPGSYYEAVLNGSVKPVELPQHIRRALKMTEPPIIPKNASISEAYEIYVSYIHDR